ncbi:hypothetical protein RB213_011171 [Colletotrichum asianum]
MSLTLHLPKPQNGQQMASEKPLEEAASNGAVPSTWLPESDSFTTCLWIGEHEVGTGSTGQRTEQSIKRGASIRAWVSHDVTTATHQVLGAIYDGTDNGISTLCRNKTNLQLPHYEYSLGWRCAPVST